VPGRVHERAAASKPLAIAAAYDFDGYILAMLA
jgi:hypothetical protein